MEMLSRGVLVITLSCDIMQVFFKKFIYKGLLCHTHLTIGVWSLKIMTCGRLEKNALGITQNLLA